MNFCSNCGHELRGDEKHCPECGLNLEEESPQEESKSIFKSKFSKKIQKLGQDTKKQIDNFDFDEFKQDASKTSGDTISDIHEYVDEKTKQSNIKKAYSNFEKENYEKSIEFCDKVLAEGFVEDIYLLKAKAIFKLKRHDDAIDLILNKLPEVNNLEYLLFLADSYKTINKADNSIEYYDQVLKIDETNFNALIGKAYVCTKARYYRLAIDSFENADKHGDLTDEDYYNWSDNLCKIRDYERAHEILLKGDANRYHDKLDLIIFKKVFNTTDLDFILNSAKDKFNQYDWKTTLKFLNQYLKFDDNNPEVWLLITKSEYYLADYRHALDSCQNLLNLENNEDNINLKGEILIGLNRFEEAIEVFSEVLNNYYLTYANLGFAYAFLGDKENAKDNFDKSLNYEYNARAWIGKAYVEDEYTDLYVDAVYRNSDEESFELIAAKSYQSVLYWNNAAKKMKIDQFNSENLNMRSLIEYVEENFQKSSNLLSEAYDLFKKFNLSKDFWIVGTYFKFINYKFLHLSKERYYDFWSSEYYRTYYMQHLDSKNSWLKIGEILFKMYGDTSYIIEQANINKEFKKFDEAIKKYDEAIELNNSRFSSFNLLYYDLLAYKAGAYKSKMFGQKEDSIKYKKFLDKYCNLYDSAIAGYNVFLRNDPNNEDILIRKAITLVQSERRAEGLLIYENILKLNPKNKRAEEGIKTIYTLI